MEEKTVSDKQALKRNRSKMYFLEAAKAMIIADGVESVSVRKVADLAGYSYPTLYNYFEDVNELLWEVRQFMIQELVEVMQKNVCDPLNNKEMLKKLLRTYMEYYLANPNIFKFFYFYSLQKPSRAIKDAVAEPDFRDMWNETFMGFVKDGKLKERDIEAVAKIIIYSLQGMLTLRFSNNGDLQQEENLYKDLEKIVDYLL